MKILKRKEANKKTNENLQLDEELCKTDVTMVFRDQTLTGKKMNNMCNMNKVKFQKLAQTTTTALWRMAQV